MIAKQLRIGNWLIDIEIGFKGNFQVSADDIGDLCDTPEIYEPIMLTHEILEKCGFDNLSGTNIYVKVMHSIGGNKLKSLAVYIDENNYTVAIVDYYTGVEKTDLLHKDYTYLHELKNLYSALTGEELNVNW